MRCAVRPRLNSWYVKAWLLVLRVLKERRGLLSNDTRPQEAGRLEKLTLSDSAECRRHLLLRIEIEELLLIQPQGLTWYRTSVSDEHIDVPQCVGLGRAPIELASIERKLFPIDLSLPLSLFP